MVSSAMSGVMPSPLFSRKQYFLQTSASPCPTFGVNARPLHVASKGASIEAGGIGTRKFYFQPRICSTVGEKSMETNCLDVLFQKMRSVVSHKFGAKSEADVSRTKNANITLFPNYSKYFPGGYLFLGLKNFLGS